MNIEIQNLRKHPEALPVLARWHQEEWGHLTPGSSVADRLARLQEHLEPGVIPSTWVALDDGIPVGSASLVAHDLESRPDLSPWLSSVYVEPESRGLGLGRALAARVVAAAAELEVPRLYLCSLATEPYWKLQGWTVCDTAAPGSEPRAIMARSYPRESTFRPGARA